MENFYEDQDVEGLFGLGRKAEDFNHFALGRALDTFYEAGAKSIFTALTLRNLLTGGAPLQFAHGDTTSKVMYGDYEDKGDPNTLKITQGYSKDKRFDLKQIVMGLVTIGRGMPLLGNVNDGNLDDKTWNGQLVDTMANALNPDQIRQLVYVADSVEKRFQQLKNPHFVNSLYLDKPERVEALAYLVLLTIMMLSVMEQVVRKGLKEEGETVIGTGKKVKEQPTQLMILRIFHSILYQVYIVNGKKVRRLLKPLNDSQAKIVRYLEIPESTFAWNGS